MRNSFNKLKKILLGGKERYHSSLAAINAYDEEVNFLFHDSVRPLVNERIISDCIRALLTYNAVDVAIPTTDTIIQVDDNNEIVKIPSRILLRNGQTPQAFKRSVIKAAYEKALLDPLFKTTDDCGVVLKYLPDESIYVVNGEQFNMKLTYKEDIFTGAEAAAKGGFTTVICMANTNPIVDNEETLEYIKEKAKTSPINVLQACAITKGFKGKELVDMKYLKECGAVGFTDDGLPIKDSKLVMEAMEKAKELDMPLSFHEEDPSLIKSPGVNEGKVSKELKVGGAPNAAEDVLVARDCMLALKTNAKISIQHISSGNSVDLVRFAKSLGAKVTAEATPHHFSITEEAVLKHKTLAKMNPPVRTEKDKEKIIEGLKDNTIEIIATARATRDIPVVIQ